jgi:hypothetical protein
MKIKLATVAHKALSLAARPKATPLSARTASKTMNAPENTTKKRLTPKIGGMLKMILPNVTDETPRRWLTNG